MAKHATTETLVETLCGAEPGDVIRVPDYETQRIAWALLELMGVPFCAGEPGAVLIHADVVRDCEHCAYAWDRAIMLAEHGERV